MKAFILTALTTLSALLLTLTPAHADETLQLEAEALRIYKLLPRPSALARHPGSESWSGYGLPDKFKSKSGATIPGEKFVEFKVRSAGSNSWDSGAQVFNQDTIKAGDAVVIAFYAKVSNLNAGETSRTLTTVMQENRAPYTSFSESSITLKSEWNIYYISGVAPKKFKKGAMAGSIHLASDKHTVALGPVFMFNMGQGGIDASVMPKSSTGKGAMLNPMPTNSPKKTLNIRRTLTSAQL